MPSPPRFDGLAVVEDEIMHSAFSWCMLRDYLHDLKKLEEQDWISFRSDMHALHDLASAWGEKTKMRLVAGHTGAVMLHLSTRVEHIKASLPALKYCHGKDFKDEHWGALLQGKLGLPKELRLESLTVGHFTQKLDVLAEPSLLSFAKQLQTQAQGEVLIREALQELAVWSQTAELDLTNHEEQQRQTSLIRNWKDLFLELGDKQSLLASLKESPFYRAFEDVGRCGPLSPIRKVRF
jgi:dynein heavy chain 2|mmetsp:Transcript_32459/g.100446  ORF Transcript_32459/g.100446 Transcript_32459/m.100446 type:complete len:237 (+) Transcript_32459:4358-5068(+)